MGRGIQGLKKGLASDDIRLLRISEVAEVLRISRTKV
jgi:hypothetical protein